VLCLLSSLIAWGGVVVLAPNRDTVTVLFKVGISVGLFTAFVLGLSGEQIDRKG
jgi:hypothetical protein